MEATTIEAMITPPTEAEIMGSVASDGKESKRGLHLRRLTREHWLNRDPLIFKKFEELTQQMALSTEEIEIYCDECVKWVATAVERKRQEQIEALKRQAEELGVKIEIPSKKTSATRK